MKTNLILCAVLALGANVAQAKPVNNAADANQRILIAAADHPFENVDDNPYYGEHGSNENRAKMKQNMDQRQEERTERRREWRKEKEHREEVRRERRGERMEGARERREERRRDERREEADSELNKEKK